MISTRFGVCHFANYIETTHLRDKIVDVILRFHFDFYFSYSGQPQRTAFVALFPVFCLTAILCFHGASIYIYLYSISICSYYTRDFPRLFFSLVFSSLVIYYFMCYMIFIYLYACEGSLCLGGTSQIYRKWSPGVGPSVRRSALEPSASPHR